MGTLMTGQSKTGGTNVCTASNRGARRGGESEKVRYRRVGEGFAEVKVAG